MKQTFRCIKCGKRLFDVFGGEPTTAISIKCPRCHGMCVFDYTPKTDEKPHVQSTPKSVSNGH